MPIECGKLFSIFMGLEGLAGQMVGAYIIIMLYSHGVDKGFIGILFSVYLVTVLLLDYPTGGLADTIGRRGVHALGLFLEGVSLLIISVFPNNNVILALAFITSGIGFAMMSGSFSAWFVDEARKLFDDPEAVKKYMEKHFSLSYGLNSGLGLLGALAASFISSLSISYPITVGGVIYLLLALALIAIAEENYGRVGTPFKTVIEGGREAVRKPTILVVITAFSIVGGSFMILAVSWQLFIADVYNLPQWSYGIIFSVMLTAMAAGSFSARYLTKVFSYRIILPAILVSLAFSLSLIGIHQNLYVTIALFLFIEYVMGVFRPITSVFINELIPSDIRATILSLYSTINSLFSSGGSYLAGYLARMREYTLLYLVSGSITIISMSLLIKPLSRDVG